MMEASGSIETYSLTGPGNDCKEVLYTPKNPCAGPHHICQEHGEHERHECFCGFTWSDDDAEMVLSCKDFHTLVRHQENLP